MGNDEFMDLIKSVKDMDNNNCTIQTISNDLKPRLCTCCGAPLHSNKCEYCDTEYA